MYRWWSLPADGIPNQVASRRSPGPTAPTWCWRLLLAVLSNVDCAVDEIGHLNKLSLLEATGGQGRGADAHAARNHGTLVTWETAAAAAALFACACKPACVADNKTGSWLSWLCAACMAGVCKAGACGGQVSISLLAGARCSPSCVQRVHAFTRRSWLCLTRHAVLVECDGHQVQHRLHTCAINAIGLQVNQDQVVVSAACTQDTTQQTQGTLEM
jgi:hypothetical protein